jgi:ferrous iron transport protein B
VGKSVIFGHLTGRYVTVSNYPGTTVEISGGVCRLGGAEREVIDTPGVNNLLPSSEDEEVTRDLLLAREGFSVIQVADTKNLRRALLITLQLAEMGLPMVLVLNMHDEALARGVRVDRERLSELLGVPVVATVATRGEGLEDLERCLDGARRADLEMVYDADLEDALTRLEGLLPDCGLGPRALGLMTLAGDDGLLEWLRGRTSRTQYEEIQRVREELSGRKPEPVGYVINRERFQMVDQLLEAVSSREETARTGLTSVLGRLSVHPIWGVPILLGVLLAVFEFVGVLGAQTLVGLLEGSLFDGIVNPAATRFVHAYVPTALLQDLLVGRYGVITMALTYALALILPIVSTFFLAFAVLEDSGYLPRLAVMVNRVFTLMGLNGKAVLPMILGLGCDTMATLTTRILESPKERVMVTLLLTLGVPCSAQLGVILALLGGMSITATLIWLTVVLSVIFLVGWAASKVIPGETSDFVLEMPPLRIPQARNILIKTMARLEWYAREAIPLFVMGTLLLFALDRLRLLALLEAAGRPITVHLLGLPQETAQSFLMGFLRRDYGGTMLYNMAIHGRLNHQQVLVALVTITLFIPCIAQFFVTIKERGLKMATAMAAFVFAFSLTVGCLLNLFLTLLKVRV